MLAVLRSIVQEVNSASNLEEALSIIVYRVKEAMEADVCSIYLIDQESQQFVLMATNGLNPEAVGKVRLGMQEGLVSVVAEREEPVNIRAPRNHPRFYECPISGEEPYNSFLGVPIIHHRKVVGVLVLQQQADIPFGEDAVTFLVTIAAQLAGAIAHAEASGEIAGLKGGRPSDSHPLQGLAGAPGVVIGTAVVIHPYADIDSVPDNEVEDAKAEIILFNHAVEAVKRDIGEMVERLGNGLPSADVALFDAYLLMLDSDGLSGAVIERIKAGNWAPAALRDTVQEHIRAFDAMEDPYLRERSEDVRDLGRRLLHHLQEEVREEPEFPKGTVLVGEEISASMLAEVPPKKLAGVVSVRGSRTSHMAILARALGIPAVMGVDDLPVTRVNGRKIIADGYSGRVYIDPNQAIRREFRRLQKEEKAMSDELRSLRKLPAETPDGVRIQLLANTGLLSDISPSLKSGAEGVGLYRTEFPFLIRDRFPGEEEQRQVYRQVLESFKSKPVVMRTLDVGGDKALPYFPIEEDNPFLGWRGIRITLDHPEIFLVQLRAMMRANAGLGTLQLLLPMISDVAEVDEAITLIHRAHAELKEEGEEVELPRIGVMIEVPSAVYQAEELASRVDFLSIGSNDLTQYLLAVDRNNPRVADLYDSLHPAVIRALKQVMKAARKHRCPVSVCGEMAGDPAAAIVLLGLGINSLSMSASSLERIKWVIRSISRRRAKAVLERVLPMENAREVRKHLNKVLEKTGLGGLVRAGK